MAYPVTTTYPTENVQNIVINQTAVAKEHWDDGVIEKQHFVYKYRRIHIINKCFDRIKGTGSTLGGLTSNSLTVGEAFYRIPDTSPLFTPDDHDSTVLLSARVRYRVTGSPGTGTVRIEIDEGAGSTDIDFGKTVAGFAWQRKTHTPVKNLSNMGIALFLFVDDVNATVEVSHLHIYIDAQGTIGV